MNISAEDFARIIYPSRDLDADALRVVRNALGGKDVIETLADMRAAAMALDRGHFPTPVIIRFSEEDVGYEPINGVVCAVDRHDFAVSVHSKDGFYEPHLVATIRRICKPGSVVIDVGANIGCHTLLFASVIGNTGRCYAFEPNSENSRLILLGCQRNQFKNVTLMPVGLSDRPGWGYFSTHIGSNGGIVSETSVARGNGGIIPLFILDDFKFEKVDCIKIDIEGGEFLALKGGEKLLRDSRPAIISEFSLEMADRVSHVGPEEFFGWFIGMGYEAYQLDRSSSEVIRVESISGFFSNWGSHVRIEDFLFLPRERSAQFGFQQSS